MREKLHYASYGSGTPIVFLHGWGVNSAVWQPILALFSAHYQVITIDLPGFASNQDIQPEPYNLAEITALIAETIDFPAVYVGWSLGGLVATELACQYPDKILALVTVASSPYFLATDHWPGIAPQVLKNFHQQLVDNAENTIKGFLKIQAMGSPNIRQEIKQITALVMSFPVPEKKVLDDALTILEQADLRTQLVNITQPFLRVYGRLDSLVPKGVIERISYLTTDSDEYVFTQASHAPFISEPASFSEYLLNWLAIKL